MSKMMIYYLRSQIVRPSNGKVPISNLEGTLLRQQCVRRIKNRDVEVRLMCSLTSSAKYEKIPTTTFEIASKLKLRGEMKKILVRRNSGYGASRRTLSPRTTIQVHILRRLLTTSSKSGSKSDKKRTRIEDYAANGGIIEGVWVFHRHGDRAPSTPLCFEEDVSTEAEFWQTKLPPNDLMEDLDNKFPLKMHKSWGDEHLDSPRYPWGALTMLGARQMHRVGDKFYHRYSRYPYDGGDGLASRFNNTPLPDQERAKDFINDWDIVCYSTNYLRTVTSARSFLDGMLYGRSNPHFGSQYAGSSWSSLADEFRYAAKYPGRFLLGQHDYVATPDLYDNSYRRTKKLSMPSLPDTTSSSIDAKKSRQQSTNTDSQVSHVARVPIHVRTKQSDPLNAFDRNFDLMMELIGNVVSKPSFQKGDASALDLANELTKQLPELGNSRRFGGPSGINWVHAADHFVCRSSHGMKLNELKPIICSSYSSPTNTGSKSQSSNENDDGRDPMEELCGPTMKHLAWRFRQWYTSEPLLAEFAGPPLREVVKHAKLCLEAQEHNNENTYESLRQMSTLNSSDEVGHDDSNEDEDADSVSPHVPPRGHRPFVVYSCHDVSILSLLYGIQAKLVVDDQYNKYWPPYASTLVFELVRFDDITDRLEVTASSDMPDERRPSRHYVRVLLNGKPVSIHDNPNGNIVSLFEFERLVENMIGGRDLTVHPHDPSMFVSSRHGGIL